MDGRVVEVVERELGSSLAADVAAGATSIVVADASDFDDAGSLTIGAETVAYTLVDVDAGTLALGAPLAGAHLTDDAVVVNPATVERLATIIGADDQDGESGMVARVPHSLYDRVPVGLRDADAGETVQAGYLADELVVLELTGQAPTVDGTFIDPDTMPPVSAGTDGSPPGASPTPALVPGIGTIHALWNAVTNADPVTYEVHLSTSTGFAPSSATLVAETDATAITIRATPTLNLPLDPATTYYVRIVAKDEDGAAAPSVEASAAPAYVTGPDIAADTITGDHIVGETITADHLASVLVMAAQIVTPALTGRRVVVDPAGIRLIASDETVLVNLPTDPNQPPSFRGDVVTGGLIVTGNAHVQGTDNAMEKGSQLTLQAQLGRPSSAPTLAFEYDSEPTSLPSGSLRGHIDADPAGRLVGGGTGPTYLLLRDNGTAYELAEYDAAAHAVSRSAVGLGYAYDIVGVARCGAYIQTVYRRVSDNAIRVRTLNQSDLSFVSLTTLSAAAFGSVDYIAAGGDGTNIVIANWGGTANGSAKQITVWDGTTLAQISGGGVTGGFTRSSARHIGAVTGRGGSTCVQTWRVVSGVEVATYELYDSSTRVILTTDGSVWSANSVSPSNNAVSSLAYGGITYSSALSQYVGYGTSGTLVRFSNWVWPVDGSGNTWWFGTTFYQSSGPYETRMSPVGSIQLDGGNSSVGHGSTADYAMRGQVRVVSPPIPTDASTERIYMLRASTAPAITTMLRQTPAATSSVVGVSFTFYIRSYSAAGASYVDTNTFPAGTSNITGDLGANVTASWKLGGDGSFVLPRMATAQRQAAPAKGQFQWNETRGVPEYYDGAAWRTGVEIVTAAVDLPSTAAHSSGFVLVTIPGLNVGDICIWVGAVNNTGVSFHMRTRVFCTVANQIRLDVYNADTTTSDPASIDHYFMVIRAT